MREIGSRPLPMVYAQPIWLVIMGVSGCGKSTLARAISDATGLPFIEGDDFHSPENIGKMQAGVPLSDADRTGWLESLAVELRKHKNGAVLSCSGLKEAYRRRLRSAVDGLKVVYLRIDAVEAGCRVSSRNGHPFPASLVDSQFAILEAPEPGPDVLVLSAIEPPSTLCAQALSWIAHGIE